MILKFTIPGPPRGQARPRFVSRDRAGKPLPFVRTHSDPKDTSYAGLVQAHALAACPKGWEPFTGPVYLTIAVTQKMPGPVEWKRKRKLGGWSTTKPDLSNVLKLVEDALIGLAYVDDKQVASVAVSKRVGNQGEAPSVTVTVRELEPLSPRWEEAFAQGAELGFGLIREAAASCRLDGETQP